MAFQFLCPQGHLLMGDKSHMGLQTQCPHCGMMFIIPTLEGCAPQPQYAAPQQEEYLSQEVYDAPASQPGLHDFLSQAAQQEVATAPEPEPAGMVFENAPDMGPTADPGIVHIACPNGHELETPLDMLGQEVLCPHCAVQFRLRNEDSREFRERQDKLDQERAKAWFNWAIAAAIIIGGGLLLLMVIAMMPKG